MIINPYDSNIISFLKSLPQWLIRSYIVNYQPIVIGLMVCSSILKQRSIYDNWQGINIGMTWNKMSYISCFQGLLLIILIDGFIFILIQNYKNVINRIICKYTLTTQECDPQNQMLMIQYPFIHALHNNWFIGSSTSNSAWIFQRHQILC